MAALGRALLQSDVSKFLQATRPLLVNGKWRKPQINARIVAKLRKEAFLSEQEFPIPLSPLKDAVTRRKGNKHERGAEARQQLIEQNMKKMPAMIEEHRKAVAVRKAAFKATKSIIPRIPLK
eukprot:m.195338 g.195338  ORF g.195338 m.195338 type:complete len:122 (-) comp53717_c0_seq10:1084-1449(-)